MNFTKKNIISSIFLSFLMFFFFSCSNYGVYELLLSEDTVDERSKSLEVIAAPDLSKQTPTPSSVYSVLVVTDMHFGKGVLRYDMLFLEYFKRLLASSDETLIPRFIINLGDTADGGHLTEYYQYLAFCDSVKKAASDVLGCSYDDYKIYTVLGNHDLYNDGWSKWKKIIYPLTSSYCFSVKASPSSTQGFSFYFLDSANGIVGTSQLESFEKKLKLDYQPKAVFTHYPVYFGGMDLFTMQNTLERNALVKDFAKYNVKAAFCGHAHAEYNFNYGAFQEYLTGAYFGRQCRLVRINEADGTISAVEMKY